MTPLNAAYAMIASWVAGAIIIEIRALYHAHRGAVALNLANNTERSEHGADRSNNDNRNQNAVHVFSLRRSVSESLRGDVTAVVSPLPAPKGAAVVTTDSVSAA